MNLYFVDEAEKHVTMLLSNLSPLLYYHNSSHTAEVVNNVEMLCRECKLEMEKQELLIIAAWFHDTGFLKCYNHHEEESKQFAVSFLKEHRYYFKKIEEVSTLISATRFGYIPERLPEKILCDADMMHMASENYFDKLQLLRKELDTFLGLHFTDKEWLTKNLQFMQHHKFYTPYAQRRLAPLKEKNLLTNLNMLKKVI